MTCMYCGENTKNRNHVCDECQKEAERLDALQQCTTDSLREKVAIFMDNDSNLSKLTGKKYYEVEDALVEFIANILQENQED